MRELGSGTLANHSASLQTSTVARWTTSTRGRGKASDKTVCKKMMHCHTSGYNAVFHKRADRQRLSATRSWVLFIAGRRNQFRTSAPLSAKQYMASNNWQCLTSNVFQYSTQLGYLPKVALNHQLDHQPRQTYPI